MADKPTPNPTSGFQAALERHSNDGIRLASTLYDENYQLREKNRELKSQAPKDGSLVLDAEQAKKWAAFEALNVDPKELKKSLERLPELEKQNKELASMEALREVSDIGIDGSKLKLSVLKDQIASKYPDAQFTFKTEKDKDGKEAKVAYIKTGKDSAETLFSEFANTQMADYLPALKVSAEAQPQVPGNASDPQPAGGPTSFFDRLKTSLTEERKASVTAPVDINARFGRPAQSV